MANECVFDLTGYTAIEHFQVSYYAAWDSEAKVIWFAGDWWELEPIDCDEYPDMDENEFFQLINWYVS